MTAEATPGNVRLNDQCDPLLPHAEGRLDNGTAFVGPYTADQMRAYAADAVAEERERFAALCRQAMPQPVANWNDAQIVEALRTVLERVLGPNTHSSGLSVGRLEVKSRKGRTR